MQHLIGERNLFDGIIFTAPNSNGGVFSCRDHSVVCLDERSTCGLSLKNDKLIRATQFGNRVVITTREKGEEYEGPWADVHSVLLTDQGFLIVSTHDSEVIHWDTQKQSVIERWKLSDVYDSWHVNCIENVGDDFYHHLIYQCSIHNNRLRLFGWC